MQEERKKGMCGMGMERKKVRKRERTLESWSDGRQKQLAEVAAVLAVRDL